MKLHKVTLKELLFRFIESKPTNKRVTYSEMQRFLWEHNHPEEIFNSQINRGYFSTNLSPTHGYFYKNAGYGRLIRLLDDKGNYTYTVQRPLQYKKFYKFAESNNTINTVNQKIEKLNMENTTHEYYEVDYDFIRKAYKAACNEWKELLERKFPKVFPKLTVAQLALKKFEVNTIYDGYRKVIAYDDHLFVPLPISNNEWPISAYKFAMEFIKKNPESCIVNSGISSGTDTLGVFEAFKNSTLFDKNIHDSSLSRYLAIYVNK